MRYISTCNLVIFGWLVYILKLYSDVYYYCIALVHGDIITTSQELELASPQGSCLIAVQYQPRVGYFVLVAKPRIWFLCLGSKANYWASNLVSSSRFQSLWWYLSGSKANDWASYPRFRSLRWVSCMVPKPK